jgi:hypothetical protein
MAEGFVRGSYGDCPPEAAGPPDAGPPDPGPPDPGPPDIAPPDPPEPPGIPDDPGPFFISGLEAYGFAPAAPVMDGGANVLNAKYPSTITRTITTTATTGVPTFSFTATPPSILHQ